MAKTHRRRNRPATATSRYRAWCEANDIPPDSALSEVIERRGRYTLTADGIWRDYDGAYIAREEK